MSELKEFLEKTSPSISGLSAMTTTELLVKFDKYLQNITSIIDSELDKGLEQINESVDNLDNKFGVFIENAQKQVTEKIDEYKLQFQTALDQFYGSVTAVQSTFDNIIRKLDDSLAEVQDQLPHFVSDYSNALLTGYNISYTGRTVNAFFDTEKTKKVILGTTGTIEMEIDFTPTGDTQQRGFTCLANFSCEPIINIIGDTHYMIRTKAIGQLVPMRTDMYNLSLGSYNVLIDININGDTENTTFDQAIMYLTIFDRYGNAINLTREDFNITSLYVYGIRIQDNGLRSY